ncbi:MAG: hypothetical protein JRG76_12455 [Deltaproteobacteria bacterium]|nr:hypothetical protein [Deltaproteobacteria bacterium]MBW2415310.1 hypothetical protein [Deltaproteobacteria bacterium]
MRHDPAGQLRPDELKRIPPKHLHLLESLLERPRDEKLRASVDRLVRRYPRYARLLEFLEGVDRLIESVVAYNDEALLPNVSVVAEAEPRRYRPIADLRLDPDD